MEAKDNKKMIEVDEPTHLQLKLWSVERSVTIGEVVESLVGKELRDNKG